MITLKELSEISPVSLRTLRYVLDHRLVTGLPKAKAGNRQARRFDKFQAAAVLIAGGLFDAGLSKDKVAEIMRRGGGARKSGDLAAYWRSKTKTVLVMHPVADVTIKLKNVKEILEKHSWS